MDRTPLDTLIALREQELDRIEALFSEAVSRELAAEALLSSAENLILEEQRLASNPAADDADVEAFSRWLPLGRQKVDSARKGCEQATLDREVVRSALIEARAAMEAVGKVREERRERERQDALRKEQNVLDELGLRQFRRV